MAGENSKIWFLFDQGLVSGPFSDTELRDIATQCTDPQAMVWKKGNQKWVAVGEWLQNHSGWNGLWYVSSMGETSGPYDIDELAEQILAHKILVTSRLWTFGLKKWATIYEIPRLVKLLGLPVRQHFRAPFVGEVKISGFFNTHKFDARSVSTGGLSLKDMKKIGTGTKLNLKITSDLLELPIQVQAQVVYERKDDTGLKFLAIDEKNQEMLDRYVMQFAPPELLTAG